MNLNSAKKNKKIAAFVMDVEDWYHLDYIDRTKVDCSISVLDGINNYAELLMEYDVTSATFSVVGDIVSKLTSQLQWLSSLGYEISCHDWDHIRPIEKSASDFREHTIMVQRSLEDTIGKKVVGYRAPSYGIDREKLDILIDLGFKYDASKIDFSAHKLYGQIDLSGFQPVAKNIWRKGDFYEFGVGTVSLAGMSLPVAGGGYIRVFPWSIMSKLIKVYIRDHEFYLFYIHPYEMTSKELPSLHPGIKFTTRFKYRFGKNQTSARIIKLIELLRNNEFQFMSLQQCAEYYDSLNN